MNNSQGIQALLDAEKEASLRISKARKNCYQYIKVAKEAANKEIETLKSKKDAEFKEYEQMYKLESEKISNEYFKYIDTLIEKSKKNYELNKNDTVMSLVDIIIDNEVQPNRNHQMISYIK